VNFKSRAKVSTLFQVTIRVFYLAVQERKMMSDWERKNIDIRISIFAGIVAVAWLNSLSLTGKASESQLGATRNYRKASEKVASFFQNDSFYRNPVRKTLKRSNIDSRI
jgi:hypothetical protein